MFAGLELYKYHCYQMRKLNSDQMRNFIFGVEDSLVSTLGILFGIASANEFNKHQLLVAGLITIVVEATSMGAGSFLSEETIKESEGGENKLNPLSDGLIMFFSYFFAGFVPLAPYLLFDISIAKYVSFAFSIVALFILGFIPSKKTKSGFKMAFVAGFAALLGFLVAHFLST